MGDEPIPPPPLLLSEIDDGLGGGCWDEENPSSESYLALPRERRQHPDNTPTIAKDDAQLLLLLQELRRQVGRKKGVAGGLGGGGILSLGYADVAAGGGEGRGARTSRRRDTLSRRSLGHWTAKLLGMSGRPSRWGHCATDHRWQDRTGWGIGQVRFDF